ncbi:hypothetical protein [Altererythrobacter sp. MTPC7]|uniref:hypothetical protein n=1 Tax=Altererythrobacter sp. MTPC7 TaxID=3056567 RepID=UPI0036F3F3A7
MARSNSFDMTRAWEEAVALLSANRQTVFVVAGVFFFLPYLAVVLLVPELGSIMAGQSETADPDAAMAAMQATMAQYWWVVVLWSLVQMVGSLSLLALLGKSGRPTLGDALKEGLAGLLPYVAAYVAVALGLSLALGLLIALFAATGSQALAAIPVFLSLPVMIYVFVKVSLVAPLIGAEGLRNPVASLRRSWSLTKGNSFRLFLFYALLFTAYIVLSLVVTLVLGLGLALFGEGIALIGDALVSSAVSALASCISLAVLAAVHRQFTGHATRASVPRVTKDS